MSGNDSMENRQKIETCFILKYRTLRIVKLTPSSSLEKESTTK